VNRRTTQQSTTATPSSRKFTTGPIALVLGLAPTASAVTLPTTVHALGHYDMGLAVIIGMAPALGSFLIVVTLAAAYLTAFLVGVLVTLGRLLSGRNDAANCVEDLFRHVINPPIYLLTLTPVKPARSVRADVKRATGRSAESPLPAVPGAARKEFEALYWKIKRETGIEPEASPDTASPAEPIMEPVIEPVIEPYCGRHAKPEAPENKTPEPSVPDEERVVAEAA
jgi:hypothetical protein